MSFWHICKQFLHKEKYIVVIETPTWMTSCHSRYYLVLETESLSIRLRSIKWCDFVHCL